ncbi:EboA domain-containing protein [uncultured Pontibacter sp.]|uniref:EboA domain-containing protein n=1 Tax=uncultured Pontibacter sp. TaxID=453356 RepID=UPI0026037D93|nr:EboA domain-containing protein [uncultured Pontibacter sp.]
MYQADIYATTTFLKEVLERSTTTQGLAWLTQKTELIASGAAQPKDLYLAFSAAPRFVGKAPLHLTQHDHATAQQIRPGFDPGRWNAAQAARTMLILSLPHQDGQAFKEQIETLFNTADMGELVALYAALPLLPHPELFRGRAAEGFRTNMGDVFEAVALDNPYPADYMEEDAWNNMVLKTLFVGKPIFRIYGIEKRRNVKLARILSDYAHERWAAGRPVSPELWRPVGPFINEAILADIQKLFSQPNELEQLAAALACSESSSSSARELLDAHPQLKARVEDGEITWNLIGTRNLQLN